MKKKNKKFSFISIVFYKLPMYALIVGSSHSPLLQRLPPRFVQNHTFYHLFFILLGQHPQISLPFSIDYFIDIFDRE